MVSDTGEIVPGKVDPCTCFRQVSSITGPPILTLSASKEANENKVNIGSASEVGDRPTPDPTPLFDVSSDRITIGMSREEVRKLLGAPNQVQNGDWGYIKSDGNEEGWVYFDSDASLVSGWFNGDKVLSVFLGAMKNPNFRSTFSIGSTKSDVLALIEEPDQLEVSSFGVF